MKMLSIILVLPIGACAWNSQNVGGVPIVPKVIESPLPLPPAECLSEHKAFPVVRREGGSAIVTPTKIVGLWRIAGKRYTYLKHDHNICKRWAKVMEEIAKRRKSPSS